jgi:thiamine-phosphate pyrophosphorylase
VTDPAFDDDTVLAGVAAAARAIPRGGFAVQLRDRTRRPGDPWPLAPRVRDLTRRLGVPLVVNRDVRLARTLGAEGVHFGADATPEAVGSAEGLWRSLAAHDDDDVARAVAWGMDAALVSPVFATPGKGPPRGTEALGRAQRRAEGRVQIFALGGVGVPQAGACFAAGADGVAVVRALLGAEAPEDVARLLWEARRTG